MAPVPPPPAAVDCKEKMKWRKRALKGALEGAMYEAALLVCLGATTEKGDFSLPACSAGLLAGAAATAVRGFASGSIKKEALEKEIQGSINPSPFVVAAVNAVAFAMGAMIPLVGGCFLASSGARAATILMVTSAALAAIGSLSAVVVGGGYSVRSVARIVAAGWVAVLLAYMLFDLWRKGARVCE